jgi:hypothetical protein
MVLHPLQSPFEGQLLCYPIVILEAEENIKIIARV